MPDRERQPFVHPEDIEDWKDDMRFSAVEDKTGGAGAHPMEAVMADEFAGFVPDENAAKTNLDSRSEGTLMALVRLLPMICPQVPDPYASVPEDFVEMLEHYFNSEDAEMRDGLKEIFEAYGGGDARHGDGEVGFVAKVRDDVTPPNDD